MDLAGDNDQGKSYVVRIVANGPTYEYASGWVNIRNNRTIQYDEIEFSVTLVNPCFDKTLSLPTFVALDMPDRVEYSAGNAAFFINSVAPLSFNSSACPGIVYEIFFEGKDVTTDPDTPVTIILNDSTGISVRFFLAESFLGFYKITF